MSNEIARKQFIIEAPQGTVWDLLGRAMYRSLPLEKMDIVSETTFRAVLRWKLAFISLPLNVSVVLDNISPPGLLEAIIQVKKGIINQKLRVTFTLSAVDTDRTGVVCQALRNGGGTLSWLMAGQQRSFTEDMFDAINIALKRLC